jgi:hypothetical protein
MQRKTKFHGRISKEGKGDSWEESFKENSEKVMLE